MQENQQRHSNRKGEHDEPGHKLKEAISCEPKTGPSKRQQRQQLRSAQRLSKFNEAKHRWQSWLHRVQRTDRAKLRADVWTDWMRSRAPSAVSPTPASMSVPKPVLTPAPGSQVQISGLQAKPELNGQLGVAGVYDETSGRCAVRLPSDSCVAIKPINLEVHTPTTEPTNSADDMADAWRATLESAPSSHARKPRKKSRSKARRP